MRPRLRFVVFTALALVAAPSLAHADAVSSWNLQAVNAAKQKGLGPNPATRALAIVHVSIHDALVAISHRWQPYGAPLAATSPSDPEAAAASAAHDALVGLFADQKAALDAALATSLAAIPDGPAKTNGVALGAAAAAQTLAARANDGATATETWPDSADVGKWRATPPKNLPAAEPHWRKVKPWTLATADAYRPVAPPAVASAAYATDYAEIKALGAATGSTRTAEQSTIAQFWVQATQIPFFAIARQVTNARGLDVHAKGRLFALVALALADARIAAWDAKYFYNAWRPITAIPLAADDGNDATVADAAWLPFIETPNHPEYPSGHSTTSAAAVGILRRAFGDEVAFTVTSDTLPDVTRSFASFTQATLENGRSRIYGGIHYQYANAAGQTLGEQVAKGVWDRFLLPVVATDDGGAADGGIADAGAPGADAGAPVADAGSKGDGGASDGGAKPSGPGTDAGPLATSDDGCSFGGSRPARGATWLVLAALALVVTRRRRG